MILANVANRERRTALIGVVAVVSILMFGRVLPAAVRWTRVEEMNADELQREVGRAVSEIRAYPLMRDSAQAWRLRLGDEVPSLLHGSTPDETSASLAVLVREAGEASGVRVGTIDLHMDSTSANLYSHHRAGTDVTGDIRGISSFLSALEASTTRIRVISVSISQSEPFAAPKQPEALQMSIVVEALARRPINIAKRVTTGAGT